MYYTITFLFFSILACCTPTTSHAQQQNDPFGVTIGLMEGSSRAISRFFGDKVEISFDHNKRDFSRNQAEIVLKDFFKNNPSKGFELIKERKTNDNMIYLIGLYRSLNTVFRVLIKGNEQNQEILIYSIDFIKE